MGSFGRLAMSTSTSRLSASAAATRFAQRLLETGGGALMQHVALEPRPLPRTRRTRRCGQGDPHPSSRVPPPTRPHVVGQCSNSSDEMEVGPSLTRHAAIAERPVRQRRAGRVPAARKLLAMPAGDSRRLLELCSPACASLERTDVRRDCIRLPRETSSRHFHPVESDCACRPSQPC